MFKKIINLTKRHQLKEFFLQKSEKAKFGGMGVGGVYRDTRSGKDYLIKRISTPSLSDHQKKIVKERTWDEILAAKFLKHAGVLVPNMSAIEDESGWVYVASSMLPGVKNCTKEKFQTLPQANKQRVYASLMMHCWLANRDIVNESGENFVIDSNNRVYHVDLGASLFSGFRSIIDGQDDVNFNKRSIRPFLVEQGNDDLGILTTRHQQKVATRNINNIKGFFAGMLNDPEIERAAHLQGALMIAKFSDHDIEALVNDTDHSKEDKLRRIEILKARKVSIIDYIQKKYGEHALLEEQISLELQRICHKHGVFNTAPKAKGQDAIVSFTAQYANALKPIVRINPDETISIYSPKAAALQTIMYRLSDANSTQSGAEISINLSLEKFRATLQKELIANSLQIFFSSYGHKAESKNIFHRYAYKGDGHDGFRPEVNVEADSITLSLPKDADPKEIRTQMLSVFNFDPDSISIDDKIVRLHKVTLDAFTEGIIENTGVRKTAVVSENQTGQVLAGKLDLRKKGVSGFATAGGNSDYPYNPVRAAREEGIEEFGHSIREDFSLIPIGSTLDNKKKNIFLVGPGGTSAKADTAIPYKEFTDGTIKYYSFSEFRADYIKDKTGFDRPSIDIYLRHYQREIQKLLKEFKINHVLVYISKNPKTLGQISFKPSIDKYDYDARTTLKINAECLKLMADVFGKTNCTLITKQSHQSKPGKGKNLVLTRECLQINPNLNPAQVYEFLFKKLQNKQPKTIDGTIPTDDTNVQFMELRLALIKKIDTYLSWRANKDSDDQRNYSLGFFTRIRHFTKFGETRAINLKSQLAESHDMDELISLCREHFLKDSRLHNHSLDTYLLEGIEQHKELFNISQPFDLRVHQGRHELRELLCQSPMMNVSNSF